MMDTKETEALACNTHCTGAMGRRCACSCGGVNHARGPMTDRRTRRGAQMILPLGWRDVLVKQILTPGSEKLGEISGKRLCNPVV